jgi:hypothetical protein
MSPLSAEQRRLNVITFGQIEVRWLYRRRLRELIAAVLADIGVENLAASDNVAGPIGDVNLN